MHHRVIPALAALATGALLTLSANSSSCTVAGRYLLYIPATRAYLTMLSGDCEALR